MNKIIRALALWLVLAQAALAQAALPYPVQFPGPASWCQGMDVCFDYTKGQGSQALAFPPGTDTHSSVITAQSSTGGWQSFNANSPVITDLGMQTVPTRTNSIRNNSMTGAAPGTPGTNPTNWVINNNGTSPTTTIAGTGTEAGIPYIDYRFTGTANSGTVDVTFDSTTAIAAGSGQAWFGTTFIYLVGGSTANTSSFILRLREGTAVGTQTVLTSATFTVNDTTSIVNARRSVNVASTNALTQAVVTRFTAVLAASGAYDFTVRIGAPQMELGAFASAPILTTSGAATVNGNQQVVDLTGRLGSGVGGIVQITDLQIGTSAFERFLEFNDGTINNRFSIFQTSSLFGFTAVAGGVDYGTTVESYTPGVGTTLTFAFAISTSYAVVQVVGRPAVGPDTTIVTPPATKLNLGGVGYATFSNGYQNTKRLALKFGAQDATTFADLFAKATILAAVSQ